MELLAGAVLLALVGLSFVVSASVGLGGSLVLVPTLTIALGADEAIPLAALLLGANNILKVIAYRNALPLRAAGGVIVLTALGAATGAALLVAAPEWIVTTAVIVSFGATLALERLHKVRAAPAAAPVFAYGSGATSGFSGMSGPLKGVALRALQLDHRHLAGGASLASLAGDLAKAGVFTHAGLLDGSALKWALAAVPVMVVATTIGYRVNLRASEASFATMFWIIMGGYTARLLLP